MTPETKINHSIPYREIFDVEHHIPFTSFDLNQCALRWWPESFGKQRSLMQYQEFWQQKLLEIIKRDGLVLDIGAGNSPSMVALNQMIREAGGEPRAVRVDLQYGEKTPDFPYKFKITSDLEDRAKEDPDLIPVLRDCSRAIAGDALRLPIKDDIVQLVLSNEFLPYLMEDRDSKIFKRFMLERHLSWDRIEIKSKLKQEPNNAEWGLALKAFNEALTKAEQLSKRDVLLYDLELLEQFFKEISRVLKPSLVPPAEARVAPFSLAFLFNFNKNSSFNQQRLLRFLKIVKDNFIEAKFYDHSILYKEKYLLKLSMGSAFFNYEFDRKIIQPEAVENLKQIFGARANNLQIDSGVLVLKK